MGKKWLDFKLREREMGWIRSTRSAVSRAGGGVRVQAGPLRGPPPSQPRAQRPGERSLGASPRSSSPRPAHAQQRGKRAPDAGAAASTFTKKTASTLHFPELGKRPTSSAWAVITHSAITSSLGTRRDREAGMSAGSRARRKERKEKKLLTRAETQKLPERPGPGGASPACPLQATRRALHPLPGALPRCSCKRKRELSPSSVERSWGSEPEGDSSSNLTPTSYQLKDCRPWITPLSHHFLCCK